eukprot:111315-Rhodomonas_salina.4
MVSGNVFMLSEGNVQLMTRVIAAYATRAERQRRSPSLLLLLLLLLLLSPRRRRVRLRGAEDALTQRKGWARSVSKLQILPDQVPAFVFVGSTAVCGDVQAAALPFMAATPTVADAFGAALPCMAAMLRYRVWAGAAELGDFDAVVVAAPLEDAKLLIEGRPAFSRSRSPSPS